MKLDGKHILVTGGAGFIGSRVVRQLVDRGIDVRVVDDLSKGEATNLKDVSNDIEFVRANLMKPESASNSLKDIDVCFHFAAKIGGIGYFHKYPATSVRDNTLMALNLWDAAKETKPKMICISSSMVFERTEKFPTPEKAVETSAPPLTGYGFSKLVGDYVSKTYFEEYKIPYAIVRPFNAYGPGEATGDYIGYAHVIPDLFKKIVSKQYPLEILGDGRQTRSYTYVDDIASAAIFVSENADNDDFNVGTGIETSVVGLANILWQTCGRKEPIKFKFMPSFKYDVRKRVPDVTKIMGIGWLPKVSLKEGLGKTVKWLIEHDAGGRTSHKSCKTINHTNLRQ